MRPEVLTAVLASRALECGFAFFNIKALDLITLTVVVEVGDADTALEARAHFGDILLESLQGVDACFRNDFSLAAQTGGLVAVDLTFCDHAASHRSFANGEYLTDFGETDVNLVKLGLEKIGHQFLNRVDQFVDDIALVRLTP